MPFGRILHEPSCYTLVPPGRVRIRVHPDINRVSGADVGSANSRVPFPKASWPPHARKGIGEEMKPSGAGDTQAVEMCRLEFFTFYRGQLIRKAEAEREWPEAQGRACGAVERPWADRALSSLHQEFSAAGRRPRWVSFHPEIPPALVADIAGGRQVVIQLRACFEGVYIFSKWVLRKEGCSK